MITIATRKLNGECGIITHPNGICCEVNSKGTLTVYSKRDEFSGKPEYGSAIAGYADGSPWNISKSCMKSSK